MTDTTERFWQRVKRGPGCWLWQGKPNDKRGYGRIKLSDGRRMLAHRFSWQLLHGDPGDLCVLHRCDNTRCVNPTHLFLGTIADNNADKVKKSRQAKAHGATFCGSRHGLAKLTEDNARFIKSNARVFTQRRLAKRFGVSPQAVNDIVRGRRWKHVD